MSSTATATVAATGELPDSAAGVLAAARAETEEANRAEARKLALAAQWAVIHPAETLDDAESCTPRSHLWSGTESPMALAGPGAPMVREFCVAELAAAVGLGPEAGKYYLGHAVELRYRLPSTWMRVMAGDLPAWKARRVAEATIGGQLTAEAARFVAAHVAPVAHRIRPAQLERLIEETIARFMPETAEKIRQDAADRRHFDIDTDQVSFEGTSLVSGELDLADALDLQDAVRGLAGQLKDLGSTDSLDARRAAAVGELARRQLALDLSTTAGPRVRKAVLHLHLSQAAVQGAGGIGRVENTRTPVTADQIRDWCGHPDTQLIVQPVIDLADHVHVEAYEVPDRIAEAVALRDLTCVFPHCTRPARSLTGCVPFPG